ncbi:MAG: hypothetical protein DRJ18_00040 [Candidatus Methanomethylicota archaeon]|nr:MAG: hypothetical protein DRJ18_00040 [Candidatus Verstraetearchaeota archaeon]
MVREQRKDKKIKLILNEMDVERILLALKGLHCFCKFKHLEDITSQQLSVTYNKVRRQYIMQRRGKTE